MRHAFLPRLPLAIIPLPIAVIEPAILGPLVTLPCGALRHAATRFAAALRAVGLPAVAAAAEKENLSAARQPTYDKSKRIHFLATISAKNWTRTSPRANSPIV
jgi:hypothetical protein